MFIQTEATPNPATLKFIPGQTVLEGKTHDFTSPQQAKHSPLAQRLFEINGVERVFFGADFITVTSTQAIDNHGSAAQSWSKLKPEILGAIMEHYMSGDPVIDASQNDTAESDNQTEHYDEKDTEIVNAVKDLINMRVRPAVAQDGGDIVFHAYKDGIVYLHMQGACAGCPSSTATLKHGIENLLRHFIPEIREVRPV